MASCGTITVEPAFDPGGVRVIDCPTLPQGSLSPGDTFQVTSTVENPNDQPVIVDVSWRAVDLSQVPGIAVANNVQVPANSTREVTATATIPSAGFAAPSPPWDSNIEAVVIDGSVEQAAPASQPLSSPRDCGCADGSSAVLSAIRSARMVGPRR